MTNKGKIQKTPAESTKPKTASHRVKGAKPGAELVDNKSAPKKKATTKNLINPNSATNENSVSTRVQGGNRID